MMPELVLLVARVRKELKRLQELEQERKELSKVGGHMLQYSMISTPV